MIVRGYGAAAILAAALLASVLVGLPGRAEETDVETGRKKAQYCAGCHGADGNSELTDYPILAGQTSRYLYLQLKDYKSGLRKSDMMTPAVAPLSKEDMLALAAFYAAQRPKRPRIAKGEGSIPFQPDPDRVTAGKKKSAEVLCTMCHLGEFAGQNEVPRVAGQHPEYVVRQLKDYRTRTRTNDAGTMTAVARTLSDEDIDNLAHYLASL
ncbi:MAG: cytochrome c4 [Deltaproteobacteria bacterium]|nr:MAG: cytochrome c4 [Deltaproteobacteria bacterium]TMB34256.1 MAG: cytochrome c4 [Deltaproteobacteria bacterium]TMB36815.1 MAG: cytochrome c4 [Deltaproteobacteria bacterium]